MSNKWDIFCESGVCIVCGKYFKNNSRRINIARNNEDDKLYCKNCAIGLEWDKCSAINTKELLDNDEGTALTEEEYNHEMRGEIERHGGG